jgi:hypothetical protein
VAAPSTRHIEPLLPIGVAVPEIPLETASGITSATLSLSVPATVVLSNAAAVCSATLDLTSLSVEASAISPVMAPMVSG